MANIKIYNDDISKNNNNICFNKKIVTNNERLALQTITNIETRPLLQKTDNNLSNIKKSLINLAIIDNKYLDTEIIRNNSITDIVSFTNVDQEYEESIWRYLLDLEHNFKIPKPLYMSKQIHLNWEMRSTLVDWLASVANEYKMDRQTLHLSINYLDRFLSNILVKREKFQLVGAATMLIASKIEEIYPPATNEWSDLSDSTFKTKDIIRMERYMLKTLKFEIKAPTMHDFIKHYCAKNNFDKDTMYLAMYLSELVLLEGKDYLKYLPSKLAAAALVLARHTLAKRNVWTRNDERAIGYNLKQLSPIVQKQHKTFKSSPFRKHQSIQTEYKSSKYRKVALLKPKILILDDDDSC